jgi:hypothetical protein
MWTILILLLLIVFVLYRGCSRCGRREGMAPNTELIENGDFAKPSIPATPPGGQPTTDTTQPNRSIKIPPETLGTSSDDTKIGWRHAADISLCMGAFAGIKAPNVATKQYILLEPNSAIEKLVGHLEKGIYDITINATGTNPISVYLKTGDASQNIYSFTPTADWTDYTKRFTVSADSTAATIAMGSAGLTGISSVSLKKPDPLDDVKNAITDMSNNVIRKMTEMTTHEDAKFADMLSAINNIQTSVKTDTSSGVNKYSGY